MCYQAAEKGLPLAAVRGVRAKPIGREPELVLLHEFLEVGDGSQALVLVGGPGIGKTTLWEAGIAAASRRGFAVLSTGASSAPARLAFAALIDLFDQIETELLLELPAPQRRALEVALLRVEPSGRPPESRAIALAALNLFRAVAVRRPLLIAVDDVQWLDSPSREVLTFAAPRLESGPVRFLLSKRLMAWPAFEHCQAHLAAGRGFAAEAERWAKEELDRARVGSVPVHELEAQRILGLAKLIAHEPGPAVESLHAVWEHAERAGVEDTGRLSRWRPISSRGSSSWESSRRRGK